MQRTSVVLFCSLFTGFAQASCGSAFCSVNTQWDTQGLAIDDGLRIDLRYSYAKANRLRAGLRRIQPEAPSGSDAEIENRETVNQVLDLDIEYALNGSWNAAIDLPLIRREHTHTFDSSVSGPFLQQAKFTDPGDIRLIAKYKFASTTPTAGSGMRLGLKLPTGATDKTMTPPDPANAPGTTYALERSAQPGTGSTDAIVGIHYFQNYPETDWGWFVNGQLQSALAIEDNYRPGTESRLDFGLHAGVATGLSTLLQLNIQHRSRDTGGNANPASGGYSINVSPGFSYALSPRSQLYGLLQIAVRQYANTDPADAASGQLTAPWAAVLGISYHF